MAGEVEPKSVAETQALPLDKLRRIVRNYIDKHHYEAAVYWADKVVSLSNQSVEDIYWYGQALYLTKQYHRASHLIRSRKLDKGHIACRYLAALCHYECKDWQEALDILDVVDSTGQARTPGQWSRVEMEDLSVPLQNLSSSVNLLRGKIYEAMDNRNLASECFREALRQDVYCYEALDLLVGHHMMSAQEERELLQSLPVDKQCTDSKEAELIQFLYQDRLKKYNKPGDSVLPPTLEALSENLDVIVSLAERHYYNIDFREAFRITSLVLDKDPYNSQCLPLHIALLVHLEKSNELFYLAHKLVEMYPDKAVAWFAVGCYYFLVGKHEPARRYLSKATTLDRVFGPAWLAFGHSFATENEHDQAMAAYFTASQLMKGCHLPVLYVGLEYGLTNNSKLAERFFGQALTIAPEDPFVLHEMGVVAFQSKDWTAAEGYFKGALSKLGDKIGDGWEPLLNNLGHTYRKLKQYENSLSYHQEALMLSPQNSTTLSAIGYVHSLIGNLEKAVDYFHKALSLKRDDTFTSQMLGYAVEELLNTVPPCEGLPGVLPTYESSSKLDLSSSVPTLQVEDLVDTSPVVDSSSQSVLDGSSMAIEEVEMGD